MKDFKREEYYGTGKYQPLDFWEGLHMPASLATMLKYLVRAGKKNGESKAKDLAKAKNYWNVFVYNIQDHVRFSYFNTYSSTRFYSYKLQAFNIGEFIEYLKEDGYDEDTIECIHDVLRFGLKLVTAGCQVNSYMGYLNLILQENVTNINLSFNKILKEAGVD